MREERRRRGEEREREREKEREREGERAYIDVGCIDIIRARSVVLQC